MMLTLDRDGTTRDGTTGKLAVNGVFLCYTLEPDEDRPAHPAIPAGTYPVGLYRSPKFGRMVPLIANVPCRAFIEIHPGNSEIDTDGCILLGTARNGETVLNSRAACELLQAKIAPVVAAGGDVTLTITENL